MRIIGGSLRGRALAAPPGQSTRPTADRVRQAIFDMLIHAAWGGRALLDDAAVLDAFAGTGALGLEALSRGAGHATFMENHPAALAALRANVQKCRVEDRSRVIAADVLVAPPAPSPSRIVFLDPPYGRDLLPRAVAKLADGGWLASGTLIFAEIGRGEALPAMRLLSDRAHGAARIAVWRV
ncbi:MAG: 16S rRNA (guanine(966)-N(2))-methyltransferase RsmD [Acetobacteraceae bacterium]|nr:16S rRNA (guanine(966)-N(2))-methyltransferase RsmD [Acetobacteraceae bacterium]